jgi:hypothetical protein
MTGLWTGNSTTAAWKSGPAAGDGRGLVLAIAASAAALAAEAIARPVFAHAVDLLSALALLVCAVFGGAGSTMAATALLVAGQVWLEAGEPAGERIAHAGLLAVLGLGASLVLRRLKADRDAAEARI